MENVRHLFSSEWSIIGDLSYGLGGKECLNLRD